ncbi:MAG: hypothetical protein Q8L24_01620 [bacterium]|nr:hypothetical protein [bacterium]
MKEKEMNFQVLLGVAFGAMIGAAIFGPFVVGKFRKAKAVSPSTYEIFQMGDHIEMTEDAKEVLGLEMIEMHGKGPFVVVGVGEADEILKSVHPQFLILRRSGDPMVIGMKFSGAQFRKVPPRRGSEPAKPARPAQASRPARIRI